LSAASISPQEKQRLIQQALSMDAPKMARQLISQAYHHTENDDKSDINNSKANKNKKPTSNAAKVNKSNGVKNSKTAAKK